MSGTTTEEASLPKVNFHEAAIVTKNGEEIAITEDMVRQAFKELDAEVDPEDNPQT